MISGVLKNAVCAGRTGKYEEQKGERIMAELKYEITESIGVLSENAKGWTKELNMVSWNEHEAKYDIREWSPDHSRMGKGVTLTPDELATLKDLLNDMNDLDSFE